MSISIELIFQILNTILILAILVLIISSVGYLGYRFRCKNKYEIRIEELEEKINILQERLEDGK